MVIMMIPGALYGLLFHIPGNFSLIRNDSIDIDLKYL